MDAVSAYNSALQHNPNFDAARNNLGVVFHSVGMVDPAARCFRAILSHAPLDADAHHNLAMVYLSAGDYLPGWEEYEWRFKTSDHANSERFFKAPRWRGEPLQGKSILLSAEQGRGDAIQFVRFVAALKEQGASVVLECQDELARLFARLDGVDTVLAFRSDTPAHRFSVASSKSPRQRCAYPSNHSLRRIRYISVDPSSPGEMAISVHFRTGADEDRPCLGRESTITRTIGEDPFRLTCLSLSCEIRSVRFSRFKVIRGVWNDH